MDETEGLLKRNVIYVGDTEDGGIAASLQHLGRMHVRGPGLEINLAAVGITGPWLVLEKLPDTARLTCACHCGGVHFQLLPPRSPEDRYIAGIDTCHCCRVTTGFELSTCTSVPLDKF